MLAFASVQGRANGVAAPDYPTFATNWDGEWYRWIAAAGYPSDLPVDDAGHVTQNAWAFMPVYPGILAVFMRVGIPFEWMGVLVSLAAGAAASLVFYLLMRENGFAASAALFSVVLLVTGPLSPLFQVNYAESLGLALLLVALLLVIRRRLLLAIPVIAVMSLTRPSGLAFACFLLLYLVWRIVRARRGRVTDPLTGREFASIVAAGLASFVAGLAWPVIAWWSTGSPSAYFDTELAWRTGYVGYGHLVPFEGWAEGIGFWLRFVGVPEPISGPLGVASVIVAVVLAAAFLLSPWARRLGVELRLWMASYVIYLLAVFFPQSSTWRLLLPLVPGLGALAVPRSRAFRIVLVVLGVLLQAWWIYACWVRAPGDWSPP
ncbi:hypothetical protein FVQ89_06950 [Homoserinibacter sp. GY 40078]|nr:hypothetical protein FVQ89_06950 [Homoserinibacter sp. GY 40078]